MSTCLTCDCLRQWFTVAFNSTWKVINTVCYLVEVEHLICLLISASETTASTHSGLGLSEIALVFLELTLISINVMETSEICIVHSLLPKDGIMKSDHVPDDPSCCRPPQHQYRPEPNVSRPRADDTERDCAGDDAKTGSDELTCSADDDDFRSVPSSPCFSDCSWTTASSSQPASVPSRQSLSQGIPETFDKTDGALDIVHGSNAVGESFNSVLLQTEVDSELQKPQAYTPQDSEDCFSHSDSDHASTVASSVAEGDLESRGDIDCPLCNYIWELRQRYCCLPENDSYGENERRWSW